MLSWSRFSSLSFDHLNLVFHNFFQIKLFNNVYYLNITQELVEYEEMSIQYPAFCQPLQMKILSTLLRDVYIAPDHRVEKARVLMKKARALRSCETVCLEDCIQCLSEAISTMVSLLSLRCFMYSIDLNLSRTVWLFLS